LIAAAFDFEWIVIAMAFIAFVRWIIERVTGKRSGEFDEDDDSTIVEDDEVRRRREEAYRRQTGSGPPSDGLDPNTEIRKFFEALGGQVTKAPPPAERTLLEETPRGPRQPVVVEREAKAVTPPPLPVSGTPMPSKPGHIGGDQSAQFKLEEKEAYLIREKVVGRKAHAGGSGLRGMLASSEGLRSAVLLHEILGPPRGLQSIEDSNKF
jgi:hypothetical protein